MSKRSKYHKDNHVNRKGYDSRKKADSNKNIASESETNSKPKFRTGQVEYINQQIGSQNDPSWYNKLRELFKDSSLISFFNQLGAAFRTGPAYSTGYDGTIKVPGIMSLDVIHGPGYSENTTDPVSLAAITMWEDVRSKLNKMNPDYSAADLGILMFTIDDLYAEYMNIWRAFMEIGTWDADNLYMPKTLLPASLKIEAGYEYSFFKDFADNLANYRMDFNTYATEANTFLFVPADFDLFKRHAWMFGNVFRDHKTRKGQLYVYRKAVYYNWDDTSETGSAARANYHTPVKTFKEYLDRFHYQIECLRNSSPVRIMISDMRQAFADHNRFGLMYVSENDLLNVVDSDEVLSQIENTEIFPMDIFNWDWNAFDVTQDPMTEAVHFAPLLPFDGVNANYVKAVVDHRKIINLHWDNPTPDDAMVATRNKFAAEYSSLQFPHVNLVNGTTEIIVDMIVWDDPDTYTNVSLKGWILPTTSKDEIDNILVYRQAFSFCPQVFFVQCDETITDYDQAFVHVAPMIEWDNYTDIDLPQLKRMNTAAMLSLWAVDTFGVTG